MDCAVATAVATVTMLQQRENFLKNEPMTKRAQTYTAIRKLVSGLDDPFTRFLEPSRLSALRRGTAGQTCSIGVEGLCFVTLVHLRPADIWQQDGRDKPAFESGCATALKVVVPGLW